jgi:hypothetical protein
MREMENSVEGGKKGKRAGGMAGLCGVDLTANALVFFSQDVPRFRMMRSAQQLDQITHVSNTG